MSRAQHNRLVLTFALAGFASAVATRITDPLVAVLAFDFAEDPARVALLATAFALPFALVQPVLGPVADALGKQRVIIFALAFQAVFLAASALAPTLLFLMVMRVLTGGAGGGIFPVTLALFGDRVPMAERQVAISRFLACAIAGQMAGGVLAGLLEPILGWRGLMLLTALLAAGAVIPLWRDQVPEPRGRLSLHEAIARYRSLLGNPAARALFWAVGIEGMLVFGAFPYFANHLLENGMGGTREAGFTLAAFGCGGFLYTAAAPWLVRRLGPARMMMLGGALAALGTLCFAGARVDWAFISGGLVLGTGFFMLHNSLQTRVTEIAPQARGSATALHAFHFFLGQAAGPPLMGLARATVGLEAGLVVAALGLLVLGVMIGRRR
ncbi:MFS transporter [Roseococcus suduntuyensis]|uniref:Putative MFS family arabinose efflux permease n=1 Tax=Roseococcus suduntuyensis TaxID=455361 RepID=A0A840A8J0_9PROT|nr:MFS transporter [Roseococcus suduntuyensis]MBB3896823.1 putative MFS family arabinose efflux permease [Roseococcus suduntuyensis]